MKHILATSLGIALAIGAAGISFAQADTSASANNPPSSTPPSSSPTSNPPTSPSSTTPSSSSMSTTTSDTTASSQQPGSDAWITAKVKAELMTTRDVPSTKISVTTNNGTVTLSGVVDSKAQVQKSVAVAKAVKGVRDVDSSALTSRQ